MSGESLAKKVGYKNQSAIGNLENRAGGNGGNKIGEIADALNVSVEWLLRGPDCENVPFLPPSYRAESQSYATSVSEPEPNSAWAWPFKDVTPKQYQLLDEDQRMDVEKYIQLQIKTREPPAKHEPPASNNGQVKAA